MGRHQGEGAVKVGKRLAVTHPSSFSRGWSYTDLMLGPLPFLVWAAALSQKSLCDSLPILPVLYPTPVLWQACHMYV